MTITWYGFVDIQYLWQDVTGHILQCIIVIVRYKHIYIYITQYVYIYMILVDPSYMMFLWISGIWTQPKRRACSAKFRVITALSARRKRCSSLLSLSGASDRHCAWQCSASWPVPGRRCQHHKFQVANDDASCEQSLPKSTHQVVGLEHWVYHITLWQSNIAKRIKETRINWP